MYKFIGADGKEYGPFTIGQINQWIAQGRLNTATKVQADGGDWKLLSEFPEFTPAFGQGRPPALPPNMPSSQPAKTSGLAIASLVLGILGFITCGITAVVGLVLGIVAINQIGKSNGTLGGKGLAIAGTIISALFIFMIPPAMLLPALARAKDRALSIQCTINMKQLGLAARISAGDHNNQLPAATNWCDALKSQAIAAVTFRCPAADPTDRCDYAFNARLSGMDLAKIDPQTVLFFESAEGWNQSGGPDLMLRQPRHFKHVEVVFVDGHVEAVTPDHFDQLRWNP